MEKEVFTDDGIATEVLTGDELLLQFFDQPSDNKSQSQPLTWPVVLFTEIYVCE